MPKLRTLAACLLPLWIAAQTPAPDAVKEWIRGNAIRLTTPVAANGFKDMEPLKKVVGDARIVSLGEATHGTREFFQLKHRGLWSRTRESKSSNSSPVIWPATTTCRDGPPRSIRMCRPISTARGLHAGLEK